MKDDVFVEETYSDYSDYETERNKPMPNKLHSKIQLKLAVELDVNYSDKFDFYSELTLDSEPASTPDLCIFPKNKKSLQNADLNLAADIIAILCSSFFLRYIAVGSLLVSLALFWEEEERGRKKRNTFSLHSPTDRPVVCLHWEGKP